MGGGSRSIPPSLPSLMGRGSWTAIRTIPTPEWTNPLVDGEPVPKRPCHQNNSKNCKNCHSEKIFFLNHAKKNSWMIGLIPRRLNTRKKASGLFCIPPHPSHGSEIPWRIPHLSLHPSLSILPSVQAYMTIRYSWNVTPLLPCVYLRVTYWTVMGLAIHSASMSGQVSVTFKIKYSLTKLYRRHFRKTSKNKKTRSGDI